MKEDSAMWGEYDVEGDSVVGGGVDVKGQSTLLLGGWG